MHALSSPLPALRWRTLAALVALTCCSAGHAAGAAVDEAAVAALGDLGLAMLRQGDAANAVASPMAAAAALGMVHAGTAGAAEQEIEALFGPHAPGQRAFKVRLPALLKQVSAAQAPAPFVMAGRVWIDGSVTAAVPAGYTQRMATRYHADAARVAFKDSEAVRGQINSWTADHTAGRIAELMPPGSISAATLITLTSAIHFRSAWQKPFDAALTEPRPFTLADGSSKSVPMLSDERSVLQAQVGGTQVLALPFAVPAFALLVAIPADGSNVDALLKGLSGREITRWQAALAEQKCQFSMPKFTVAAKSAALRPLLESLGVKTVFTAAADLRPMLGRNARNVHLGDVFQAAGIAIDERGGEAVAAAAAAVQSKSLMAPSPPCAVDRPFVFAVVHRPTGTPLFLGRVGDPALTQ
jgi:serpin B